MCHTLGKVSLLKKIRPSLFQRGLHEKVYLNDEIIEKNEIMSYSYRLVFVTVFFSVRGAP